MIALMIPTVMALEGSDENDDQVISLLTNGASKAMYLTYQCDMEINKDHVLKG